MMLLMTDLGHDPDDAIAIAYLIENGKVPDVIILSPGFPTQVKIAAGICMAYDVFPSLFTAQDKQGDGSYNPGKHKMLLGKVWSVGSLTHPKLNRFIDSEALIIGPAKNLGGKLKCGTMVFQGGYSPNSIKPLEKFRGVLSVQSFNPCGAKNSFNDLLESKEIVNKFYVGKNVCHGFTKADLQEQWEPENQLMKDFWNKLSDGKAMHDVLAAQCLINPCGFEWERAKPVWHGNKLSTEPTDELIFSLIGR